MKWITSGGQIRAESLADALGPLTMSPLPSQWHRTCKHCDVTGDLLDQPIFADLPGVRIYV